MEMLISGGFVSVIPSISSPENKRKRKRKTTTTKNNNNKKKKSSTHQRLNRSSEEELGQKLGYIRSIPNPSLPDELILNIVARVPRLYYPTLSLVSKSFRSLLDSPELYKTRSLLGHTESCLYVCIYTCPFGNGPSWFTLCRKPNQKKKTSGYVLAKVPISRSPKARFSSLVAIGSNVYSIGACDSWDKASSSSVSILDCKSNTWLEAPSLPVELFTIFSSSVRDGKIYVTGRCKDDDGDSFKDSFQVLDTKTQVWDGEPINFLSEWDQIGPGMSTVMPPGTHCEIENVLYTAAEGTIRWYDNEVKIWRNLNGLVGLPKFPDCARVRLADYGGNMVVLWDKNSGYERMILCAEIVLERPKRCEIWGKVEWFNHVLTVYMLDYLEKALVVTV